MIVKTFKNACRIETRKVGLTKSWYLPVSIYTLFKKGDIICGREITFVGTIACKNIGYYIGFDGSNVNYTDEIIVEILNELITTINDLKSVKMELIDSEEIA